MYGNASNWTTTWMASCMAQWSKRLKKYVQRHWKMTRMEKAPIMGVVQAVSDRIMRRSAGNLPKIRTICSYNKISTSKPFFACHAALLAQITQPWQRSQCKAHLLCAFAFLTRNMRTRRTTEMPDVLSMRASKLRATMRKSIWFHLTPYDHNLLWYHDNAKIFDWKNREK